MKSCYSCNREVDFQKIYNRDVCPLCNNDLHTCHNCRFFDKNANRGCREPGSLFVGDKDKYNYCEWFEFAGGHSDRALKASDSKKKLEDLFRKK